MLYNNTMQETLLSRPGHTKEKVQGIISVTILIPHLLTWVHTYFNVLTWVSCHV